MKGAEIRRERSITLRSDFHSDDERNWQELATRAGVALPPYGIPCTTGRMEKFLRKIGLPVREYLEEISGYYTPTSKRRLSDWPDHNPTWPLKAWVGVILEYLERRGRIPAEPSSV